MNEKTRKRRDFIQNIAIALLSVSAVLLFTQTQIYNLGRTSGYLQFLSATDTQASIAAPSQSPALSAPVQVAVTGPYGRYGSVTLTTTDESFEPLRTLLEQALGSARTYTVSDQKAFLAALQGTSVYYDFLTPLPLSVLAELMWTSCNDSISARRLVVAEQETGVSLYLWDDGNQYFCCDTALSLEDLAEATDRYEFGNALFAFDTQDASYQAAAPCSLFLEEEPVLPVLSSAIPLPDTDQLLTTLGFNPNTQNRYPDSSGTEVIMESGCTLRIRTDGTITYQGGGSAPLSVKAAGETPTLPEAATGAASLLGSLLSTTGEATIYLEEVQQDGLATILRFGYQVSGVPIRFSDGQSAAEVILSGTAVSSMTLRIRQYTATEADSLLLPLRQALAIAARQKGAKLSIGYADNGSGTVSAQWLAD